MASTIKRDIVWAIMPPEDEDREPYYPRAFGWDEHTAWCNFFNEYPCKPPLGEAKKAYKAIGFRCVEFKMVEVVKPNEVLLSKEEPQIPKQDYRTVVCDTMSKNVHKEMIDVILDATQRKLDKEIMDEIEKEREPKKITNMLDDI